MFINIISGIVMLGAVGIILLRTLTKSGLPIEQNILTTSTYQNNGFSSTTRETASVFGLSLLFRAIVFIVSIFAIFITTNSSFSIDKLLKAYMQWDANNYYRIALGGYSYHIEDGMYTTLAFFPLYPWCVRAVNLLFQNLTVSGIITSSLLYSGGCALLYKLMSFDYNKSTAVRCVVFISIFPHSFFFGTMMSESMFFFTSATTLYYIRRHDWIRAGVFGAFASMSRLAGVLLVIPATVEWLEHYQIIELLRRKSYIKIRKLFYKKALWILLMFMGIIVYLFCNYQTSGDCFKFMEYQNIVWNNTTVYWGECLSIILKQIQTRDSFTVFSIWIPELVSIVFVVMLLIYGLRKTRNMYTSYLAVYIIINMSMAWPLSIARYMSCAIPAFMILSEFSERHRWCEHIITTVIAILFGIFFTAYFMGKQIM